MLQRINREWYQLAWVGIITLALVLLFFSSQTHAQTVTTGTTCTDQPFYDVLDTQGADLLNGLMNVITNTLSGTSEAMYNSIATSTGYRNAIFGLVTLYIAVYAIMVMFQMAPATGAEVIIRLVKIAFIAIIVSPDSWTFFDDYVRSPLIGGMNELIVLFNNASTGRNDPLPTNNSTAAVTAVLATPIGTMLSSRMFLTIQAMIFTGPYGFVYALLVIWALGTLFYVIVAAVGTYIKALVGLYFLFAVAPIFFAFLLFQNGKHIFDGWIKLTVNFVLQPIFTFAFLGYFMTLILAAMSNLLKTPVCYTKFKLIDYGDLAHHMWRFKVPTMRWDIEWLKMWWTGLMIPINATPFLSFAPQDMQMYEGGWGFCGPDWFCGTSSGCGSCLYPIFPVNMMDILLLILITQLAMRYMEFIAQVSTEVSGASTGVSVLAQQVRAAFVSRGLTVGQLAAGGGKAAVRSAAMAGRGAKQMMSRKPVESKSKGPEGDTKRPDKSDKEPEGNKDNSSLDKGVDSGGLKKSARKAPGSNATKQKGEEMRDLIDRKK